ncbi:MAG: adenylate/guanylate cyclase domain-containing protein [Verrucomicrobiales bacterium]
MSRHLLATLIIAVPVSIAMLLLGDVPVFENVSRWLLQRFQAEGLAKGELTRVAWLQAVSILASAFGVAWVAVDLGQAAPKIAIAAVASLLWGFLSLTLAFYGLFFDPFPSMAASILALASGLCFAETPRGRRTREIAQWFGSRVSQETLSKLRTLAAPLDVAPETREVAVLACRVANVSRSGEKTAEVVKAARALLEDAADFLRGRPGVVLDLLESDGVRAFFGFLREPSGASTADACIAALELKAHLNEFAELNRQAGRSPLHFGIGVSTGPLLIGLLGTRSHPAGTASGAAADHARHLAATALRNREGILVGRRGAQLAAEHFELRPIDGESLHVLLGARDQPAEELGVAEEAAPSPPAASAAEPLAAKATPGAAPITAVSRDSPSVPVTQEAPVDKDGGVGASLGPPSPGPAQITPATALKPKALKKPKPGAPDRQQKTD